MTILMGRMNIIHWKSLEMGVPYFHISPDRVTPTAQSSRISYQPIGTTRVTAWMFWTLLIRWQIWKLSYRVPNILGDGSNQTLYTGQIDLSCFGLSNHPISSSGTQFWPRPHLSRLIKYRVQSWCSPQVWCARAWGLAAVGSKQRAEKWSCFCRASQAGAAFAAGVALSEVCRWRNCIGPSDWCDMQKFGGGFGVLKITALDVALPRGPKHWTDQTQVAKEWARLLLVFFLRTMPSGWGLR